MSFALPTACKGCSSAAASAALSGSSGSWCCESATARLRRSIGTQTGAEWAPSDCGTEGAATKLTTTEFASCSEHATSSKR